MKILGISGSLRRASFNTGLLRAAAEALPEGDTLALANIGDLPLFDSDLDDPALLDLVEKRIERGLSQPVARQ